MGYHRLYSHIAFKAKWPVRLFVMLFGAASFENSAIDWVSDHRKHHKHVDHDDDPYDISKGFWYAHIGWLLFKLRPEPPLDNVNDMFRDPLAVWQHKYVHWIGLVVGFVIPPVIGFIYGGPIAALGAFLLAGVLRVTVVQHSTFCINSVCHTFGKRTYSSQCSARDSGLVAFITFGEGYHNYHHEFQHDYRNGVKPWQFDPTKWSIWLLSKVGLASDLRRVPQAKILLAELTEARRRIDIHLEQCSKSIPEHGQELWESTRAAVQRISDNLAARAHDLQEATKDKLHVSQETVRALRQEVAQAMRLLDRFRAYIPASA